MPSSRCWTGSGPGGCSGDAGVVLDPEAVIDEVGADFTVYRLPWSQSYSVYHRPTAVSVEIKREALADRLEEMGYVRADRAQTRKALFELVTEALLRIKAGPVQSLPGGSSGRSPE